MSRIYRYEYTDWKGFGERTKRCREEIGLSKEKFAELINRSENFVSDIEKGRKSGSVHTVHQIAKVLKVSVDSLLYGENMNDQKTSNNREIIHNIIDRCDDEEINILKDIIVAVFPNLDKVKETRLNEKK